MCRLITLGAPCLTSSVPRQELAIFGASDPIIPFPDRSYGPCGRVLIVPGCGHVGLLYYPTVLGAVASFLGAPVEEPVAPAVLEAA